jgi:hypothetical protein
MAQRGLGQVQVLRRGSQVSLLRNRLDKSWLTNFHLFVRELIVNYFHRVFENV